MVVGRGWSGRVLERDPHRRGVRFAVLFPAVPTRMIRVVPSVAAGVEIAPSRQLTARWSGGKGGRTPYTGQTVCSLYSSTSNRFPFRADGGRRSQSRHPGRNRGANSPDRRAAFPRAGKVGLVWEFLAVCTLLVVVVVVTVALEMVPRRRGMWVVEVVTAAARRERSRVRRTAAAAVCSFLGSRFEPVSFEVYPNPNSQGDCNGITRERRNEGRLTKLAPFQNGKPGGGKFGWGGGGDHDAVDCPVYCESSLRGGGGGREGAA